MTTIWNGKHIRFSDNETEIKQINSYIKNSGFNCLDLWNGKHIRFSDNGTEIKHRQTRTNKSTL